jgi:hypothetical protein
MNPLRPVDVTYAPGYPATLTEAEIRDLLRPCLLRRFPREAMLIGAIAAGTALAMPASARPGKPGGRLPALPRLGTSTRTDPAFRAKVDKLIAEVLGHKPVALKAALQPKQVLAANPAVAYPKPYRIHFGTGVQFNRLDVDAAREATVKLFKLYGIELKKTVTVKGEGFEFVADGYSRALGVGFELITPQEHSAPPGKYAKEAERLDAAETKVLDAAVKEGRARMFVTPTRGFATIGRTGRPPMQYYLESVVDYLNWVHGDRQVKKEAVKLEK